ncbi:MAG: SRPBCC family protein [Deltaproteobacteria bacterium]|jgi:carbon monoxide dehydrogenase subunit G|nr:SRPBCC family protein [Deltaproteobacteria bacterium]
MAKELSAVGQASAGVSASEVWQALRRFGDLSWATVAGVESFESEGEGLGMLRKAWLPGEAEPVVEQLVELDEPRRMLRYEIVAGGTPGLTDYSATARVVSDGRGCEIEWACRATASGGADADAQALLDGLVEGIVSAFAAQFR